ncbi:TPA: hypothetical protein ACTW4I_005420, partial [Klebsiella quasipneumoniae subsp. quasipneumoniae]
NKAESSVERLSFFAFLSSGEGAGTPPRWRCAYRGYGSDMELRPCGADKICSTDSGKNIA